LVFFREVDVSELFGYERQAISPTVARFHQRRLALWLGWGFLMGLPILLPMLPKGLKAPMMLGGFGCGVAATLQSWQEQKGAKRLEQMEKAEDMLVTERLTHRLASANIAEDINFQMTVLEQVLQAPPILQAFLMQKYELQPVLEAIAAQQQIAIAPAGSVAVDAVPIPASMLAQPSLDEAIARDMEASLDTTWFERFLKRSGIVCGESGDGKSFLLNYALLLFMQNSPNGEILIGDMDYGSSHEGAEPNTWQGLTPNQHILISADKIKAAIARVSTIVDKRAEVTAEFTYRKAKGKDTSDLDMNNHPLLLIVDEFPALMATITEAAEKEAIVVQVANILRRGLKQNVRFLLGTQSLAVKDIAIQGSIIRQLETVILWRAAGIKENYSNLGLSPGEIEKIITEIKAVPRKVGSKRPCVTLLEKNLSIKAVPEIQMNSGQVAYDAPNGDRVEFTPENTDAQLRSWLRSQDDFTLDDFRNEVYRVKGTYLDDLGANNLIERLIGEN
jgi:hypothetical protein